jgi:hypothetical protein
MEPEFKIVETLCPMCKRTVKFFLPPSMADAEDVRWQKKMYEDVIKGLLNQIERLQFDLRLSECALSNCYKYIRKEEVKR